MTSRRFALLFACCLPLIPAVPVEGAVTWTEEAEGESSVSSSVRDATVDYGHSGHTATTQIIYEGTVERFPFGHRQPALVCAPLRICEIVLEEGEIVLDVVTGDAQHWQTFELSTGPGGSTPIVGVRPMVDFELGDTCNKTTNLVITTDRRFYDVLLELPPCTDSGARDPNPQRPYHRQLSFYYPDDLLRRWTTRAQLRALQADALAEDSKKPAPTRLAAADGIEDLNWRYNVRPHRSRNPLKRSPRFPWRPAAVFDDGVRTYIKLPEGARDLPAIFEVTGGEDAIVNFSPAATDPSLLVVPRVAEHLVLVLPHGDGQARLHLINEALQ
ncbi:MAG: TrbG/VirB9 family P-type conjugative transfer protein [bacterium]|nr:TrbG/VirB9 family P-type conjugative transfer protein [bacterium]